MPRGDRLYQSPVAGLFGGRYRVRTCDPCRVKAMQPLFNSITYNLSHCFLMIHIHARTRPYTAKLEVITAKLQRQNWRKHHSPSGNRRAADRVAAMFSLLPTCGPALASGGMRMRCRYRCFFNLARYFQGVGAPALLSLSNRLVGSDDRDIMVRATQQEDISE